MAPVLLVTGKTGQVGFELQRSLGVLGQVVALDRLDADLSRPDTLREAVGRVRPDVIVNAAAYTAVDKAESEPELARTINGTAPGVLAEEAAKSGALLVHYSTDYVFAGDGSAPHKETDAVAPASEYGRSKLAGEEAIRAATPNHVILRTSWVYGAHGGNFLKTALRLIQERDSLRIVADQHGAPTSASLIADVTAHVVRSYLRAGRGRDAFSYGTYHLTASGETTWHGYARLVASLAQQAGLPLKVLPDQIDPIPTSAYPLPAPRPANSRLDTSKLRETFELALPDWQEGVRQVFTLLHR